MSANLKCDKNLRKQSRVTKYNGKSVHHTCKRAFQQWGTLCETSKFINIGIIFEKFFPKANVLGFFKVFWACEYDSFVSFKF